MANDVFNHILQEHRHLTRLFEDVHETFLKISNGDFSESERREAVSNAKEDLAISLEEMLSHFNEEEEVFFVEIERRFPDLSDDIKRLVQNHESITGHTRWLLSFMSRQEEKELSEALEVLRKVRDAVVEHTNEEARVYGQALERLDPEAREQLLEQILEL